MGKNKKEKKSTNKKALLEIKSLKKKNNELKKKLEELKKKNKTLKDKIAKIKSSKGSKFSKTEKKPKKVLKQMASKSNPGKPLAESKQGTTGDQSINYSVKEALTKLRSLKSTREVIEFSAKDARISIKKAVARLVKRLS